MSEQPLERSDRRHATLARLGAAQRVLLSAVALALVGTGGVAVFVAANYIGATALVVSGAILLLFAVGGSFPTRLKFGDFEIAMPSEVVINEALDRLPTSNERTEFVTEVSSQLEPAARDIVAEIFGSYTLYEQAVTEAIARVAESLGLGSGISGFTLGDGRHRFDGTLSDGRVQIFFEVKYRVEGTRLDSNVLQRIVARVPPGAPLLVVSNANPTNAAAQLALDLAPQVQIATWSLGLSDAILALAIRRLLKFGREQLH